MVWEWNVTASVTGYECVQCSATFQVAADHPMQSCCFCLHPTKSRAHLWELWNGPALPIQHDRQSFVEAIEQFLKTIGRGYELALPAYRISDQLKPVWMPFRRIRVRSERRVERGSPSSVVRQDFELDVFCGAGLDEHLAQELQRFAQDAPHLPSPLLDATALRAGEASDDDLGVRAASSLRRWLTEHRPAVKAQELSARFLEAPEAGQLYWMPVWLHAFESHGEQCVIAMDAVEGRVVAHLPRSTQPVDYLRHLIPIGTKKPSTEALPDEPTLPKELAPAWMFWPLDRLSGVVLVLLSSFTMNQNNRFALLGIALIVWLGGALSRAYLTQSKRFARSGLADDLGKFKYYRNLNAMVQSSSAILVASLVVYWVQHGLIGLVAPTAPANTMVASDLGRSAQPQPEAPALAGQPASVVAKEAPAPQEIVVGSGGVPDIARAVALSRPNDVIRISAELHPQYNAPIIIDHNLKIIGERGSEVIWHNGTGPFVQVVGQNLHVSIEHLHLTAKNNRGAIVGATSPLNDHNVLTLKDVWVDSQGASAIQVSGKGSVVNIIGGGYRSDKVPMVFSHLAQLNLKADDQMEPQIEINPNGSERVEHAIVLSDVKAVTLESANFIGNSGANVAVVGDIEEAQMLAVSPNRAAMMAVLGDAYATLPTYQITEPGRYRIHQGRLEVLEAK